MVGWAWIKQYQDPIKGVNNHARGSLIHSAFPMFYQAISSALQYNLATQHSNEIPTDWGSLDHQIHWACQGQG